MSETPRTDHAIDEIMRCADGAMDIQDFTRELERENNELRENYNRILEEQREAFREGTWYGNTTSDYKESISGTDEEPAMFSLAYQWQDKKHRHVFDLCDWIDKLQDELKELI